MLQDHANNLVSEVTLHKTPVGPTSHSWRYDLCPCDMCPYAACCSTYEMQKLSQHKKELQVRRGLWQPGMIQNQKKKILMRNKLPLHLWPELKLSQKLSQRLKPNQILMKKMGYFLLSLLMTLKHVY